MQFLEDLLKKTQIYGINIKYYCLVTALRRRKVRDGYII